jgi:hypothetical protein
MGAIPLQDAHRLAPAAPDEGHVYGACSPGWHAAADYETCLAEWIEDMRAAGIERVCCLMTGPSDGAPPANVQAYESAFGSERVLHAPVPNGELVSQSVLAEQILPFLRSGKRMDEPVVVHGLAGLGRTGQVLAAWLVAEYDYRAEEAVRTVKRTGRDPSDAIRRGNATEDDLYELLQSVA